MKLRESNRKYILIGMVVFIVLGVLVAKVMAKSQDDQFLMEDALYQQASQLASNGNYAEATTYINELLVTHPNSEAVNYLGGMIAANNGEMKQAAILLQRTMDINPYRAEDAIFMLQFGEALYGAERYEDAMVVLTRCKEWYWVPESYPNYQAHVTELLNLVENKL